MSTICASSYARIFIKNLEAKHIYTYIKEMSLLYLRCIGDIFMICKGSKAELMTFIKELNEKHKTIKVHFQISQRKIVFLDTMLYNDENKNFQTTLYRKATDEQAFLQVKSKRPGSLKNGKHPV